MPGSWESKVDSKSSDSIPHSDIQFFPEPHPLVMLESGFFMIQSHLTCFETEPKPDLTHSVSVSCL